MIRRVLDPTVKRLKIRVIMEYLVKISKKARILELKRRHLKITILTSYMSYPSRKIRRICVWTSLKTTKEQGSIRLIMECFVKISKKARILELKRRHLKKLTLTSNTPYPSRMIRRIYACTSLKTTKEQGSIRRSCSFGKDSDSGLLVYKMPLRSLRKKKLVGVVRCIIGKLLCMVRSGLYEDVHDLRSVETEFPVHNLRSVETEFPPIVLNDALTPEVMLSCEPTVSPLNDNQIDFRISFDESDDEDHTVIYDKNSFSYKIISVDDLKTDSENDNDKVNMPSFPSPEPTVSYFNNLDFFKYFENEFPAFVYNDALTSKLDFLNEPAVGPQHIDEFNMKDEISLSECDEEEQNVIYFNDLFPFTVVDPDDLSDKDNDNDKINIERGFIYRTIT
ncbi:hypothetical protein Tco_0587803 [Tanacetum coccineum]